MNSGRLGSVDTLRGAAALAVCWFHVTNGNPDFLTIGWLKASGAYGWLGVDAFFVISGFIIPYSMSQRGYRLRRDAAKFIAKRVVRLDPPYFVAVLLSLTLWYASALVPGFRGDQPHATVPQVLAHVGYLNGLLGFSWLNPVFWSLAIEFQFYLSVSVAFPLLANRRKAVRLVVFGSLLLVALASWSPLVVLRYLGLFACGFACFHYHSKFVSFPQFLAMTILSAGAVGLTAGVPSACVAFASALFIVWRGGDSHIGRWFGKISYSVYLVHVPIGGRVINAGMHVARTPIVQVVMLSAALAASILAAWIMYRLIEYPAQRWSSALKFGRRLEQPALPALLQPSS